MITTVRTCQALVSDGSLLRSHLGVKGHVTYFVFTLLFFNHLKDQTWHLKCCSIF